MCKCFFEIYYFIFKSKIKRPIYHLILRLSGIGGRRRLIVDRLLHNDRRWGLLLYVHGRRRGWRHIGSRVWLRNIIRWRLDHRYRSLHNNRPLVMVRRLYRSAHDTYHSKDKNENESKENKKAKSICHFPFFKPFLFITSVKRNEQREAHTPSQCSQYLISCMRRIFTNQTFRCQFSQLWFAESLQSKFKLIN